MTDGDYSSEDEKEFNEALRLRDSGELVQAISILDRLAKRRPRKASVWGMLAGIQFDIGDFAESAVSAAKAVGISPKSELASQILFHALFEMNDIAGAFDELARFRSIKESDEYERILMEVEADVMRDLQTRPADPFLNEVLRRIRQELNARPVRQ